jgi:hypothetical protein
VAVTAPRSHAVAQPPPAQPIGVHSSAVLLEDKGVSSAASSVLEPPQHSTHHGTTMMRARCDDACTSSLAGTSHPTTPLLNPCQRWRPGHSYPAAADRSSSRLQSKVLLGRVVAQARGVPASTIHCMRCAAQPFYACQSKVQFVLAAHASTRTRTHTLEPCCLTQAGTVERPQFLGTGCAAAAAAAVLLLLLCVFLRVHAAPWERDAVPGVTRNHKAWQHTA